MRGAAIGLVLLLGCGGPTAAAAPLTIWSDDERDDEGDDEGDGEGDDEDERVERAPVVRPAELATRLAALPAPPIPWGSQLAALSTADVSALCGYDTARPVAPVATTCAGAEVVVGRATCAWTLDDALGLGAGCDITVGDVVACRVAIAYNPCARMGFGLPECVAFAACLERRRDDDEATVFLSRMIRP